MKIAFLGTGLMGQKMAERLLEKGFNVTVWNRTKSKTENLKMKGADVAQTPSEAIIKSELIITMLSDFNAVCSVLFSEENNFGGKTVLQMSTIAPDESEILCDRVEQFDGEYLEAPVLGGLGQIPEGKLLPMVGSTKEQFEKWKPFLENFAESVNYMGEVGKGAAAKLACNQLIASLVTSFAMSLGYIQNEKIDVDAFMNVIRQSSYFAPAFDRKLNNMISRDFSNTNFPLKHLLKDINLALKEFFNNGINTIPLEGVKNIFLEAMRRNYSEQDYSALYSIINPDK